MLAWLAYISLLVNNEKLNLVKDRDGKLGGKNENWVA